MEIKDLLKKQHYALVGKSSSVQICRWAKRALLDEGFCYKQQFYGIKSHLCCQMSPATLFCQNKCMHCWRAIEFSLGDKMKKEDVDEPKEIIDKCILAQRKMLTGFKGNKKINMEKWKEAQNPSQFAISLSGEPTVYPKLGELIKELRIRKITSFLVTNGLNPEILEKLGKEGNLPTQLYVSLNSSNKEDYEHWHRSIKKDAWKRFNETLELFPKLNTRKVVRMTLVREKNMSEPENYAKLIKKANPDFVEVKAYMSVGFARERMGYETMPTHAETRKFAEEIASFIPEYKILDEKVESRVVLLGKSKARMKIKESEL